MREEEDKVGREVTTRILYILWNIYHQDFPRWLLSRATRTRARRTSEGAKRASSRLSFPSSAAISRSFSPLPSPPTHPPLFPFRRPLPERSLRGRSCRRKMAKAEMCTPCWEGCSRVKREEGLKSFCTLYTSCPRSSRVRPFVSRATRFHFPLLCLLFSDLESGCLQCRINE